jgi:hypothetical protein
VQLFKATNELWNSNYNQKGYRSVFFHSYTRSCSNWASAVRLVQYS